MELSCSVSVVINLIAKKKMGLIYGYDKGKNANWALRKRFITTVKAARGH